MTQDEPTVGKLYSCEKQSTMHGGDWMSTLPDLDGEVMLIRFKPAMDPDGPNIIDHGPPDSQNSRVPKRIEMLRRQSEPLPVYKHVADDSWEYLGRYRVQSITDGGPEAAERSKIVGRPIRYVIRLKKDG